VWKEKFDKTFLDRERLFNVEDTEEVRANDLKGESHQGLRHLVTKNAFQ
jgi:hypothetical protein